MTNQNVTVGRGLPVARHTSLDSFFSAIEIFLISITWGFIITTRLTDFSMAPAAFDAMHLISPLSSFDTRVIVNTPEIQFSAYGKFF